MNPKVTVLMPVYNCENYLKEAIDSILSQTYTDFEFLIINDASTDNSVHIINSYHDERIRLVNNDINIGQAYSQNKGIKMAKGKYIVRMDADDISLPDRIKKQVEFMESNLEIGISGCWINFIGHNSDNNSIWKTPTDAEIVKCMLLFDSATIAVIMRKLLIINNNLFYKNLCAEDYDLWIRASKITKISNINEVLYLYRRHPEQISSKHYSRQDRDCKLLRKNLIKQLRIYPNKKEFEIHNNIMRIKKIKTKEDILYAKAWLEKLNYANHQTKVFDINVFTKFLAERWFKICYNACQHGVWAYKAYYSSDLSRFKQISSNTKTKYLIKCAIKHSKHISSI